MTNAEAAPAFANAVYSLGSSQVETTRLERQADELAADSRDLLDRMGLRPGHSAIDLGCGPRGLLDLLAERVSPAAASSAWTPIQPTRPWLRTSSVPGPWTEWSS
jgi:hypothetical protein